MPTLPPRPNQTVIAIPTPSRTEKEDESKAGRKYFRVRTDSSNSTRGSFTMHRPANIAPQVSYPSSSEVKKKHKHLKKQQQQQQKPPSTIPTPTKEMTLADVASLALTLEIDNEFPINNVKEEPQSRQEEGPIFDSGKASYGGMQSNHMRHMSNEVRNFSAFATGEVPPSSSPSSSPPSRSNFTTINTNFVQPLITQTQESVKHFIWDPEVPEFTSLQQFNWAVMIGVFMGVFTALWSMFIEWSVDKLWVEFPEKLMEWGLFTDLDGFLPLPHYMWICPAFFCALLALMTELLPLPMPSQDTWIDDIHRVGVSDSTMAIPILVISTIAMASGLNLGPELPLVLITGMFGSKLAELTHQSILSSRVLNLVAAGAGVGGFFGFPMAGALFAMEIPHRMGLQYFEALSPATIASIVAVIFNRIVSGNEVKGYFNYPFLNATLPSHIFYVAVMNGLVGTFFGVFYTKGVIFLKMNVHDWFHAHDHDHDAPVIESHLNGNTETVPLVAGKQNIKHQEKRKSVVVQYGDCIKRMLSFNIKNDKIRVTVVGFIAGGLSGMICMFFPALLFWGEGQLQTLIDDGETPLPFFKYDEDEPTSQLIAYGYCVFRPEDQVKGFSIGCSTLFVIGKTAAIGLSLGSGVIGGHFWGPLFVGAAGANLFLSLMKLVYEHFGICETLYIYPCVTILCVMGSTHVVIYRAHMAIMLILTLTISSFKSDTGEFIGGDYSAVFPLLVVSCFVTLMVSRNVVFYKKQQCRGDIIATPEVLCEPNMEGKPEYPTHEIADDESMATDSEGYSVSSGEELESHNSSDSEELERNVLPVKTVQSNITSEDIEREFLSFQSSPRIPMATKSDVVSSKNDPTVKIDEILAKPLEKKSSNKHRRVRSDGAGLLPKSSLRNRSFSMTKVNIEKRKGGHGSGSSTPTGGSSSGGTLMRVHSFGKVDQYQPSLMNQARSRSSSAVKHERTNSNSSFRSIPRSTGGGHRRKASGSSGINKTALSEVTGAISQDDIERAFSSVQQQVGLGFDQSSNSSSARRY